MELRPAGALDFLERLLARQRLSERLLSDHGVERVRDDQEVRRQWNVVVGDSVVAGSVESLAVIFDGLSLPGSEPKTLKQAVGGGPGTPAGQTCRIAA